MYQPYLGKTKTCWEEIILPSSCKIYDDDYET